MPDVFEEVPVYGAEEFYQFLKDQKLKRNWRYGIEDDDAGGFQFDSATLQVTTKDGTNRILSVSDWNGVALYKNFFKKTNLFQCRNVQKNPVLLYNALVEWIDEPADDILNLFYEIAEIVLWNKIGYIGIP